jgi:poly(3-hydroxybutyrate) depolymerase
MEERNIIWVAARMSGNKIFTDKRILYALTSVEAIQQKYQIDPERVYITGFSGGGRVSSIAATKYPTIFKGSAYICGANYWGDMTEAQLNQVQKNRFGFITGTQDFNLNDTKQVYSKYKKSGIEKVKLMVISRMGHANPKRQKFNQALSFLDDK